MAQVDILIPVYNREKFLKECLVSIEGQTMQDWRVIFYDDGSTDASIEIMEEFKVRHPNTIILEGSKNRGVGYARNKLLKSSDAPYCAWQDSDDVSLPSRLDTQLSYLQNNDVDMVFTEMYFFKDPSTNYRPHTTHKIDISRYINRDGLHNNMNFATAMFKGELRKYPFRDMQRREDAQWLSDMIDGGVKFGYIPKSFYSCRRHSGRLTNNGRF